MISEWLIVAREKLGLGIRGWRLKLEKLIVNGE